MYRTGAVTRAKAVLGAEHQMTEPHAHRWMQEESMTRRVPLGQVADAILDGQIRPGPEPQVRGPRFDQAARAIRRRIAQGLLPSGSRITVPEVRTLHGLSRHSAQRLLQQLTREHLLRRQPGDGYYVTGAQTSVTLPATSPSAHAIPAAGAVPAAGRHLA